MWRYLWCIFGTGKSCKTLTWLGAAQIHNIPRIEGILASQLVVGTHRIKTHDFPSYETIAKIISHSTCMYILLNTGSNIFPFTFDFNYVHLSVDNNIGFFYFDFIYLIHSVWVYYFKNRKKHTWYRDTQMTVHFLDISEQYGLKSRHSYFKTPNDRTCPCVRLWYRHIRKCFI